MMCKKCGTPTLLGPERHVCPPAWLVWCPEHGDLESDATVVYAYDAEAAAMRWAERYDRDSAEYAIVRGTEVIALVRPVARKQGEVIVDDRSRRYAVRGESVPTYTAKEIV